MTNPNPDSRQDRVALASERPMKTISKRSKPGWDRAVPQEPLDTFARSFRDFVILSKEEGLSQVATLGDTVVGFASVFGGALRAIYVEDPYRRQLF